MYQISDTSDIFFGPDGQISSKYRHLFRISDISDENDSPERSDIFEFTKYTVPGKLLWIRANAYFFQKFN